jgi:hypothetical protein
LYQAGIDHCQRKSGKTGRFDLSRYKRRVKKFFRKYHAKIKTINPIKKMSVNIYDCQHIPPSLNDANQESIFSTNILSALQIPVASGEVQSIVASIMAAFGFSTDETADVLRIEKKRIFAWMNGEKEPDIEDSFRLRSIEELAKEWNKLCRLPAETALRIPFDKDGITLWNELCKRDLNYHNILRAMASSAQFVNTYEVPKYADDKIHKNTRPSSVYNMINLNAYMLDDIE